MNVQSLYKSKAMEPGSELWISPQADHSDLTKNLNWYSNFILSKMLLHKTPEISAGLSEQLKANQLEFLAPLEKIEDTYLAETSAYFPNKMLLMKAYDGNLKNWLETCHKSWSQLQKPSLRFFLPKAVTKEEFLKHWPESSPAHDVSIVCN